MPTPRPCETHLDLVKFGHKLRTSRMRSGISARSSWWRFGSSSTAGADNILPFPPRLEMLLRQRFFGRMIDVNQPGDRRPGGAGGVFAHRVRRDR
ncbi:hypothetical protein QIH80_24875 [Bradyrhizobium elkanii]|nr:hypothetical protein QIH80_24875 [Bradyrhizobium elkanii]